MRGGEKANGQAGWSRTWSAKVLSIASSGMGTAFHSPNAAACRRSGIRTSTYCQESRHEVVPPAAAAPCR